MGRTRLPVFAAAPGRIVVVGGYSGDGDGGGGSGGGKTRRRVGWCVINGLAESRRQRHQHHQHHHHHHHH